MINNLTTFKEFISSGESSGYKVSLKEASYHDNWPAERFIDHLAALEYSCTKDIEVDYFLSYDQYQRISEILIVEHHLATENESEQRNWTRWTVHYLP